MAIDHIPVKALNVDSSAQNRFKFRSFRDRVKELKINVAHRVVKSLDEPSLGLDGHSTGSYFEEALLKWKELNCTLDFSSVFEKVRPLSQSLGQILHHKEDIIKELLSGLKVTNTLACEPLLILITMLARDLQDEFMPFYDDTIHTLVGIIPNADVDRIEWIYNSIAYLFKYLSTHLTSKKDSSNQLIIKTFNVFSAQLMDRKIYIRNLAAEALGYLLRKASNCEGIFRHILSNLSETRSKEYVHGISMLFFETFKQVGGSLHSKSESSICILLKLVVEVDSMSEYDSKFEMLQDLFLQIGSHTSNSYLDPVWQLNFELVERYCNTLLREESAVSVLALGKVLNILSLLATLDRGAKITDRKKVFKTVESAATILLCPERKKHATRDYTLSQMVRLFVTILSSSKLDGALVYGKKTLELFFKSNDFKHIFALSEALRMKKWTYYPKLILPMIFKLFQEQSVQSFKDLLPLLQSILSADGFLSWIGSISDCFKTKDGLLKINMKNENGKQPLSELMMEKHSSLLRAIGEDIKADRNCGAAVAEFYSMVACFKSIECSFSSIYAHLKNCLEELVTLMKNTSVCHTSELIPISSKTLQVLVELSLMNNSVFMMKELEESIETFLVASGCNPLGLQACADYFEAMRLSKSELQNSEKILHTVQAYVGSIFPATRLAALRVVCALKPHEDSSADLELVRFCLDMELVPESGATIRDKTIHLRKIEQLQLSGTLSYSFKSLGMQYLFGCLSTNFNPLSEEIVKSLRKLAEMNQQSFWNVYESILDHFKSGAFVNSEMQSAVVYVEELDLDPVCHSQNAAVELFRKEWQCPSAIHMSNLKLNDTLTKVYSNAEDTSSWLISNYNEAFRLPEYRFDCPRYYTLLIRTLSEMPNLVEQKSSQIVPLFTSLFYDRIQSGEVHVEPGMLDGYLERERFNMIEGNVRLQTMEFLNLFAKVKKPQRLFEVTLLRSIFLSLLASGDNLIQSKALSCIVPFKSPALVNHVEMLEKLVEDEYFRDTLSTIDLEQISQMNPIHVPEFMEILSRILYGKLISRKKRGSSKAGAKARRTAIFAFVASLQPENHVYIFDLMIKQFEIAFGTQNMAIDETITLQHADAENIPDTKQQIGFLHVLEDLIRQLKTRIVPFLPRIMLVILNLLKTAEIKITQSRDLDEEQDVDTGDVDDDESLAEQDLKCAKYRDVRVLALKRLKQIFEASVDFSFDPFMPCLFDISIIPRLDLFSAQNTQAPSALLELFAAWSKHSQYCFYLKNYTDQVVPQLLKTLCAPKVKDSVLSTIADIFLALINLDEVQHENHEDRMDVDSMDKNNAIFVNVLGSHVGLLLTSFYDLLQRVKDGATAGIQWNKTDSLPNRLILILTRVSAVVNDETQALLLVKMMIPFLKKTSRFVGEKVKTNILCIMGNFVMTMPSLVDNLEGTSGSFYQTLCLLFSTLETKEARLELVSVFSSLSKVVPSVEQVFNIISDVNSFSIKRLDEPDFDRRFDALKRIGEQTSEQYTARQWLPILHNLLFYIRELEEYSIRTACVLGIKKIVELASKCDDQDIINLVEYTIFPSIKRGIKLRVESVRQEYLFILEYILRLLPTHPRWSDMVVLLANGDDELNFFSNIYHLQMHRRKRALKRLSEYCRSAVTESDHISSNNMANIICPIISHFIFESDRIRDHQFVTDAINSLAVCTSLLKWGHYYGFVKRYMESLEKNPQMEKALIRLIVEILDHFNFEIVIVPESKDSGDVLENSPNLEEVEIEENEEKDDLVVGHSESAKIGQIVIKNILPRLFKYLSSQDEDGLTVRVAVAVSIAKLLKKLPLETFHVELPKLIISLCNILKSKQQSARDSAREIVVKVSLILGMKYVPFIIKELKSTLCRGYQLHVLGYTIHSLLLGLSPTVDGTCPELDHASEILVQIFMADIFGDVGAEREVEELRSKMKEIKKTKSFESFEILSKLIAMPSVGVLLRPLKLILLDTDSSKITSKVDEVLKRIAAGLVANKTVDLKDMLIFINQLISENLILLKDETTSTRIKSQREKNYEIQMTRPKNKEGVQYFQTNSYRFVEFGFSLLLVSLKQGKLNIKDDFHLSLLDPFVLHLGNALYSKHESLIGVVVRILYILVKFPLPSMNDACPIITKKLLQLVSKSVTTVSELMQGILRLLALIIRDCKFVAIKEEHLVMLLNLLRVDLEEPERQHVSFALVKAIISRKLVVDIVYDVMDDIARLMITNQSSQSRELCRSTYLQFMLEYPQGSKRLQNQMSFLIKNLQYEFESGRESVMELLNLLVEKFPLNVILEFNQVLFVALVVNLVNDESSKCRQFSGILIKRIYSRIGLDRSEKLLDLAQKWMEQMDRPNMLRTGAQVYGLAVDVFQESLKKHMRHLFEKSREILVLCKKEVENDDPADCETLEDTDELKFWESGYYTLGLLQKMLSRQNFGGFMVVAEVEEVLQLVSELLLHPHQWIRSSSARVLGQLFAMIDPSSMTLVGSSSDVVSLLLQQGFLYRLALDQSRQLNSMYITEDGAKQVVKNMFFMGKCLYIHKLSDNRPTYETKEEHSDDEESSTADSNASLPLLQWIRKMSYYSRAAANQISQHIMRMSTFQWFAAMITVIDESDAPIYFLPMLSALFRTSKEETFKGQQADELRKLAVEVMSLMEKRMGTMQYLELYNQVRSHVNKVRQERKQKLAVETIAHPEVAAKKKIQKNVLKKERRKRKLQEVMNMKFKGGMRKRNRTE